VRGYVYLYPHSIYGKKRDKNHDKNSIKIPSFRIENKSVKWEDGR